MNDTKVKAIVLKRTNYGEADRILQILTENGKTSVMAKSARKERSRLAGSIELFSLSEVVIHKGKGDLGVLTGARLIEFYGAICSDLSALELAGSCLRDVSKRSDQVDNPEFFSLLAQTLAELNRNLNQVDVIRAWWLLNLLRASGEEINLRNDTTGQPLQANQTYTWNTIESTLEPISHGTRQITADHIKLMRLMLSAPLKLTLKVQNSTSLTENILHIAKCLNQSVV
jgi:DNA repair protein RecO (recombination protein O)